MLTDEVYTVKSGDSLSKISQNCRDNSMIDAIAEKIDRKHQPHL